MTTRLATVVQNSWAVIIKPRVAVPAGCVGTNVTGMGQEFRSDAHAQKIPKEGI